MSFASYQAMAGVAGRGLQLLLRHKDARMTMRYSHVSRRLPEGGTPDCLVSQAHFWQGVEHPVRLDHLIY
jgi:hypothetical protein